MIASLVQSIPLPGTVKSFLIRALVIFVAWKLLYHLVLFPIQVPDQQLREVTAQTTAWFYNLFPGQEASLGAASAEGNAISVNGGIGIRIANGCNGLELFVVYIGFLFCYRSPLKRQLLFTAGGVLLIYVLNVLRCAGLVWLISEGSSFADFAHHYFFKMIIYSVIFGMWVLYTGNKFQYVK